MFGTELAERGVEELFAFVVDGFPLFRCGVAGGSEEFVVEDGAGCADECDDPGDVPLPGVFVAEDVDSLLPCVLGVAVCRDDVEVLVELDVDL